MVSCAAEAGRGVGILVAAGTSPLLDIFPDRTPVDVCFSPGLLRKINAKRSFWSKSAKSVQTGLQLTTDVRQDLFREASSSSGLYQLAILLQVCLY